MPLVPKGVLGTAIYAGTDYKDEPAILGLTRSSQLSLERCIGKE